MSGPTCFTTIQLTLAGSIWLIHACDEHATLFVNALADVMSLPAVPRQNTRTESCHINELHVYTASKSSKPSSKKFRCEQTVCLVSPAENEETLIFGMLPIAEAILRTELSKGGLLIHGALAEATSPLGGGILFAGQGNVGKTTTSNRLPTRWKSLSDDASLVLRDVNGQYWAHPWPTWSRFFKDEKGNPGPGGNWDIQTGIPLKALFFLAQAEVDRIEQIPFTPALAFLMETVQQASWPIIGRLPNDKAYILQKQLFAVAEEFVQIIPTYTLHLSLTGAFWELIEETFASISTSSISQCQQLPHVESCLDKSHDTSSPKHFGNNMLTVQYSGSSMNPTLRHPDLLHVVPYRDSAIRCGDVLYFTPPTGGQKLVHRVVGVTAKGISTRGDNNTQKDPYLLQPSNVIGRVTEAWRHNKPRKISGGTMGKYIGYIAGFYNRIRNFLVSVLHGLYRRLPSCGLLPHMLPSSLRPRIFEFKRRNLPSIFKLLFNGQVIGHYDPWSRGWVIKRPWSLLVDESKLRVSNMFPHTVSPIKKNSGTGNEVPLSQAD